MVKPSSLDGRSFKISLRSEAMKDKSIRTKDYTTDGRDKSIEDHSTSTMNHTNVDQTVKTSSDNTRVETKTVDNQTRTDKTSQDNTMTETEDMKNSQVQTDVDMNSLNNKTIIVKFENGIIHSTFLRSSSMDNCPYNISNTATAMISFKAMCVQNSQTVTKAIYTWDGTIDGKNITGNLTKKMDDGKIVSYSFTGTETNASDASKDLGDR